MWITDEIKENGTQIIEQIQEILGNAADDRKSEASGKRKRVAGEIQESFGKARRKPEEQLISCKTKRQTVLTSLPA